MIERCKSLLSRQSAVNNMPKCHEAPDIAAVSLQSSSGYSESISLLALHVLFYLSVYQELLRPFTQAQWLAHRTTSLHQ